MAETHLDKILYALPWVGGWLLELGGAVGELREGRLLLWIGGEVRGSHSGDGGDDAREGARRADLVLEWDTTDSLRPSRPKLVAVPASPC